MIDVFKPPEGRLTEAADAPKTIIDRSRWRNDERHWVREGKLPRCGWMPDAVLESETWKKLAPQREAALGERWGRGAVTRTLRRFVKVARPE